MNGGRGLAGAKAFIGGLQMLAARRSNQAIARGLVGRPGDRQKHVSHSVGKCSAASHTGAFARGRQLALIP